MLHATNFLHYTKETYIRMFELLKKYIELLSLCFYRRKFHIDFEAAALKAIHGVFPAYEVKGCLFHFYQAAVWRKVQSLGLTNYYRSALSVKR